MSSNTTINHVCINEQPVCKRPLLLGALYGRFTLARKEKQDKTLHWL